MHSRRRFLAAAALRGRIYAIGGEDDGFAALCDVECFSEQTSCWELLPPMPTRRRGLAAVVLRGKLYAVGGGQVAQDTARSWTSLARAQTSQALDTVEQYDADLGQ